MCVCTCVCVLPTVPLLKALSSTCPPPSRTLTENKAHTEALEQGCQTRSHRGPISLEVPFEGPSVVSGLCKRDHSLTGAGSAPLGRAGPCPWPPGRPWLLPFVDFASPRFPAPPESRAAPSAPTCPPSPRGGRRFELPPAFSPSGSCVLPAGLILSRGFVLFPRPVTIRWAAQQQPTSAKFQRAET